MRIVIIGDGKVGHKLTAQLSDEQYDIFLIDQNEDRLQNTVNHLDVACIHGDAMDAEIQKKAGVAKADIVIACTSADELNMLSCLIAKRLGAKHTIARVRSPIYYEQIELLKEDLRLSMAVNPELIVAGEIARVLTLPDANKVEIFMKGKVELIEYTLRADSYLAGLALKNIYQQYAIRLLVCAVRRGEEIIIPDGEFILQAGDHIHITAEQAQMKKFFKKYGNHKHKLKNILICGGGRVSFYLAKRLKELGMNIKIIEKDYEKCENLSEVLEDMTIIHGDASDDSLLLEEGIEKADAIVTLTGIDETNIIAGLFGKSRGVRKIVAKVNEDTRAQMVEGMGIDSIVSAKEATANTIVSYVRAKRNSIQKADVETIYQLVGGKIEAMEFIVQEPTQYTDIALKDLKTKANCLIACIGRGQDIIIPGGDDWIEVGDSVIIISLERKIQILEDILDKN